MVGYKIMYMCLIQYLWNTNKEIKNNILKTNVIFNPPENCIVK